MSENIQKNPYRAQRLQAGTENCSSQLIIFKTTTLCKICFKFNLRFKNYFVKEEEDGDQNIETTCYNYFSSLEMEFDFMRANCNIICSNPAERCKVIS